MSTALPSLQRPVSPTLPPEPVPARPPTSTPLDAGTVLGWAILSGLGAGLATLAGGVLYVGLSSGYYLTPFDARPDHPLYDVLRPGGTVGVLLAVVGTGLMIAMQAYSVRKRLPPVSIVGSPGWWLRFHILCGVSGPALIVLHGGLYPPAGLVAVGFWCMLLVGLSGGFGRYVYGYFPRSAAGKELTLHAAAAKIADLRVELVQLTAGAGLEQIGEAVALGREIDHKVLGIGDLFALDLEVRRRARRIRHLLAGSGLSSTAQRGAARTLVAQLHLKRGIETWQVTQRLFRYWHLFHEPLAKAMYLIVAWHVFVALAFGGALEALRLWVSLMPNAVYYAVVLAVIVLFLGLPTWLRLYLSDRRARKKLDAAVAEGRHEPATIRPVIDPGLCMGSGACVKACPEDVLQIINGQARVVEGAKCVGHGACAAACPVEAIELVFGSERRGVDLPAVHPNFQSNVPGIFVAGELGGMGLIANAVEQGVQALRNAARGIHRTNDDQVDVVIVGAGPAGFGAALAAKEKGLSYVLLEQESFGGALRHYPRQKIVMTRPMSLPGFGTVRVRSPRKEALIELFEEVVAKTGLRVTAPERVDAVGGSDGAFTVRTDKRELRAARVILTVGRRGTPRRLETPGEELEKVAYRLVDAELYQDQHLLVVGGGDSALEAAVSLAEQPGNRVTLSYRGEQLNRPKADNLRRLREAEAAGALSLLLGSVVTAIGVDRVSLAVDGAERVLPNDFVFVFAGGVLPTALLTAAGVDLHTHYGKRVVRNRKRE